MRELFERLRELLRGQLTPPLRVSSQANQYWFDSESAAYAEIDVRDDDGFVIVIVYGSREDEFIARTWHRHAPEIWLVDPEDRTVTRALRDGQMTVLDAAQMLTSSLLPGVAIPVAALFTSH